MKPDYVIHHGDCREELAKLPEKSCHVCVTSPPYHGLRKYQGVEPSVWGDGDELCAQPAQRGHQWREDGFCDRLCGAWFGLLGLEPTIDMYIEHIVECFRAAKRVLRDDGTLWVIVGDRVVDGQFAGVTWKLAEAMKADGWLLRCPIVWVKTDANMDSASTRPRMRHEYILVFAKSKNHYFDQDAVEHLWRGSVWPIATSNLKGEHYAPFPRQLVEKCVRLGSSEHGCCPECGKPWIRNVSSVCAATRPSEISKYDEADGVRDVRYDRRRHIRTDIKTLGWKPGCECVNPNGLSYTMHDGTKGNVSVLYNPVSCAVLDCYCGSGTTGVVATQQGRRFVGIDASETYCNMARRRIANPEPEPEVLDVEGQMMFEELEPEV